jgi:hypothetical protein
MSSWNFFWIVLFILIISSAFQPSYTDLILRSELRESSMERAYYDGYYSENDYRKTEQQRQEQARSDEAKRARGIIPASDQYKINSPKVICGYNAYNCADFKTHAEAQKVFRECGANDIHHLDGDDDGLACETLP